MFLFCFFPPDLFRLECALAAFAWLVGSRGKQSVRKRQAEEGERERCAPIGFPDVYGLLIHVLMLEGLLVQEVEEVLHRRWNYRP